MPATRDDLLSFLAELGIAVSTVDHQPVFTIEARLKSGPSQRATAGSKRQAEQAAAKALLEELTK